MSPKTRAVPFDCEIKVDFNTQKIIYPKSSGLILGDATTSNFAASENFVVLECVDRLFRKGYAPNRIELEKKWGLGHKHKGKLDILVKRKDEDSTYMMIECKTYPTEYEKEKEKMLSDGGQLFTYWQQDRAADILILYTSRVEDDELEYDNSIVQIETPFRETGDVKEAFERWNKQFVYKGVFEDDISAYNIELKPLLRRDLRPLREEDGNRIYQQFLEILRHNTVSDKGNAFNKIFNMFLCKIWDEDRPQNEVLEFQWIEGGDNEEKLLGRLNTLYKRGMLQYLDKEVTDYSAEEVNLNGDNEQIRQIINELRLYKNQEFAFVDVFNKESFIENAKIVVEIVKLLQGWQIRYTKKQQFLGEFFELLLNTGFKQESGQFFTPIPLVRFILRSLPIEAIITKKIADRNDHLLPYTIDFACGSGHFLTEAMDILQDFIQDLDISTLSPAQKKKVNAYKVDEFGWANEFVYGIEKDYRLAKTSKLASFLNGDGEARIIHGSGIAPFNTKEYTGRLKTSDKTNNSFDVLVANPPYAVRGFRSTVEEGSSSFKLYKDLSDRSDKIETLFIERMTQLVSPGGVVGIVLPRSILSGNGMYERARRLIFENFVLVALVILGDNAFMATGINTVVFFLRKRITPIKLSNSRKYKQMCRGQNVVIVKSGEKDIEKMFLGYEFSNRKGSEGLKLRTDTFLFDNHELMSDEYANSYILRAFLDKPINKINERLANHVSVSKLNRLFDWDSSPFSNGLVYIERFDLVYRDDKALVSIASLLDSIESGNRPKGGVSEFLDGIGSLGGEHIDRDNGKVILQKMKYVPVEFYNSMTSGHVSRNDILVNKDGAQTGKCAIFDVSEGDYCVNEHLFVIRSNGSICLQKYLFYFMMSDYFQGQVKVYAYNKKGQPGLTRGHFEKIKILLLPLNSQEKVIKEIDAEWPTLTDKDSKREFVTKVFGSKGLQFAND